MLTPVQQTPQPLDPLRQQITPTPPVAPTPPPRQADVPLQPGATSQDRFNPNDGRRREGNSQDRAQEDQQQAKIAEKLRNAYMRLSVLQHAASQALHSGDAKFAKELAEEAVVVAGVIRDNTTALPRSNAGTIEKEASDLDTGHQPDTIDVPSAIDTARAGLGAAKDVVDSAAMIPHHPVEDRIAINGMRSKVLRAMADVETFASQLGDAVPASRSNATAHLDIKA